MLNPKITTKHELKASSQVHGVCRSLQAYQQCLEFYLINASKPFSNQMIGGVQWVQIEDHLGLVIRLIVHR